MELHTQRIDAPPLPSATVVLLRDGPGGLEVFLQKRAVQSDVLAGVYVFPGGKVDRDDAAWAGRLDVEPARLPQRLGEAIAPREAAALHVAAVREVFEETGVLFAPVAGEEARRAWCALREGAGFAALFGSTGWPLHASRLFPWSRWVTPVIGGVVRKRFDARFFVAAVPPDQEPTHDTHEATASLWLTPREALVRYWEGGIELAPPQIMTLAHLARHANVAEVVATAQARRPPLVEPVSIGTATAGWCVIPATPGTRWPSARCRAPRA